MKTADLLILTALGYLAYTQGWLKGLLPAGTTSGGTPPASVTEDQAALIVSHHRTDVCSNMSTMSGGVWNCSSTSNTVAAIREWFYHTDPTMVPTYGTLANYVAKMNWS